MQIILTETGKKYNSEWIFRNINYTFEEKKSYAILGRNGSGKSTLLQIIAGNIHPSAGKVKYYQSGQEVTSEEIYRHLTIVAPYLEIIEDFSFLELLGFHFSFKSILPGQSIEGIIALSGLNVSTKKPIKLFSSGMKQRVKLLLALMSDVPLLLLDEPLMNLDPPGIEWFLNLLREFTGNRTILVCSNAQIQEVSFCTEQLLIEDYKQ